MLRSGKENSAAAVRNIAVGIAAVHIDHFKRIPGIGFAQVFPTSMVTPPFSAKETGNCASGEKPAAGAPHFLHSIEYPSFRFLH